MIDWDRVSELQEEIGEEDFAEVGQVFIEEITEKLDEIAANAAPDPGDFHFLRGSAANLGLTAFAEACKSAELATKAGETVELAALRGLFSAALEELDGLFELA